jgi:hypothetical protein
MRAGGKYKGLANLPEARRIDVRQEIAKVAGVCPRNVSNAKTILQIAHPCLISALQEATPSINGAMRFCKSSRAEQSQQFVRYSEERATSKVIRKAIAQAKAKVTGPEVATILEDLRQKEAPARFSYGESQPASTHDCSRRQGSAA